MTMTQANVAKEDVRTTLGRITNNGYIPPSGVDPRSMVDQWFEIMKRNRVTVLELEWAVGQFEDSSERFWPKPGDFVTAIRRRRREDGFPQASGVQRAYNEWNRHGRLGPCPVCSAEFDPTRGDVFHSDKVHRQHGIAYSNRRGSAP